LAVWSKTRFKTKTFVYSVKTNKHIFKNFHHP